jgi:YhcH/YjgK/YiaL family protein
MILDSLENAGRYAALHPAFADAFAFLRRPDLASLAAGRHEISDERLYAMAADGPGKRRDAGKLEAHDRYIDVQLVLEGTDEMGWKPRASCSKPAGEYDAKRDVRFFADEPDAWVAVRPGQVAIFFPEDAHLPMVSGGRIRKVVVKVRI